MPDPEISRRCSACGATVRYRAMFCPQCGSEMETSKSDSEKPFDPLETIADELVSKRVKESSDAQTNLSSQQAPTIDLSATQPVIPTVHPTVPLRPPPPPVSPEKAETQLLNAFPVESFQQPKRESTKPGPPNKVGKLKKVSTVVLDQAAYDPSVRFLLVAAGLFLLFLFLLILSKVVG